MINNTQKAIGCSDDYVGEHMEMLELVKLTLEHFIGNLTQTKPEPLLALSEHQENLLTKYDDYETLPLFVLRILYPTNSPDRDSGRHGVPNHT